MFYVDPDSQAALWVKNNSGDSRASTIQSGIAVKAAAKWLVNGDKNSIKTTVNNYVSAAATANQVPIMVAYNIPNRDCGSYSAGGAASKTAYEEWITGVAEGIGNRNAVIVIEPDALPLLPDCLTSSQVSDLYAMLNYAVTQLTTLAPKALVYLDASHSNWQPYDVMAQRPNLAGVKKARGFALNVSNYRATSELKTFGDNISAYLNSSYGYSKPFIIDSSRNGNGPKGSEWCDPLGRKIGASSAVLTGNGQLEMNLWLKLPGEADGCAAGAGVFSADLAVRLVNGS